MRPAGTRPRQTTLNADARQDMWPGITRGWDARCSCTWAPNGDRYEVKVRDTFCVNHGGPDLGVVLSRMARWGIRGGD